MQKNMLFLLANRKKKGHWARYKRNTNILIGPETEKFRAYFIVKTLENHNFQKKEQ
jgi:hypothetical protein